MPRKPLIFLLLVDDGRNAKIWQEEFNKYLELAFYHNIINDKDLENRLRSKRKCVLWQVFHELMCAYFSERILNYKISFYPRGSGNTKGDLLLEISEKESIFVEVKAPYREFPKQFWVGNDYAAIKNNLKRAIKKCQRAGKT